MAPLPDRRPGDGSTPATTALRGAGCGRPALPPGAVFPVARQEYPGPLRDAAASGLGPSPAALRWSCRGRGSRRSATIAPIGIGRRVRRLSWRRTAPASRAASISSSSAARRSSPFRALRASALIMRTSTKSRIERLARHAFGKAETMYVAVKGGEAAIAHAHRLLADRRRGDRDVPALTLEQIAGQLSLAVDRVMAEGSLYDPELAALAVRQARGDLIEAIFLLRAYRTTLPRFGSARQAVETAQMRVERRMSATYKDLPGGPTPRSHLRLHPPPARPRSDRRHRRCPGPERRTFAEAGRLPARHRHPQPGGSDRGRWRPRRRRAGPGARRSHPRPRRASGRAGRPLPGAGAGGRGFHPGARLFDAARLRPRPSLRRVRFGSASSTSRSRSRISASRCGSARSGSPNARWWRSSKAVPSSRRALPAATASSSASPSARPWR